MGPRRAGFTLIEVLVVIAIISILAAILLPVFAGARESGRRSVCASNLRQIGMAATAYVQDYDERLPCTWDGGTLGEGGTCGSGGWIFFSNFAGPTHFDPSRGSLYPYVKSAGIYQCPSDVCEWGDSYAINSRLSVDSGITAFHNGIAMASIREPACTFLFVEEGANGWGRDSTDDAYMMVGGNILTRRHHGGSLFAYCDGHVKHLQSGAVTYPNPVGAHRYEP